MGHNECIYLHHVGHILIKSSEWKLLMQKGFVCLFVFVNQEIKRNKKNTL